MIGKRGASGLGITTEAAICDWALSALSYVDIGSTYFLAETMRILNRTGYDQDRIIDMVRTSYDPSVGRFGADLFETWYGLKSLAALPGVRIDNRELKFWVSATTPYSFVQGKGWYADGSSMALTLDATTYDYGNQTRRLLTGWYYGETCLSRAQTVQLVVSKPLMMTVRWGTQYYVAVNDGGHDTVSGSRWYDKGAMATAKVLNSTEYVGATTRYVFTSWQGASTSTSASVSIVVDGPKILTAKWTTQYWIQVTSERGVTSGEGWYSSGSTASVSVVSTTIGRDLLTNYVFEGWKIEGSVASTSPTYSFTVTRPLTVAASWRTEMNAVASWGGVGIATTVVLVVAYMVWKRYGRGHTKVY